LEPGMLTSVAEVAAKTAAAGKLSDRWHLDINAWIASMRRRIGV